MSGRGAVPEASCALRVRYAETDQMGVVYYANYLAWFEVGRADLLRRLGMSYKELEATGVYLPVVEAHCRYLKPARYDDVVEVTTRATETGPVVVRFDYEVRRAEDKELLATGSTRHAAVGRDGRPRRLPETVQRLLA